MRFEPPDLRCGSRASPPPTTTSSPCEPEVGPPRDHFTSNRQDPPPELPWLPSGSAGDGDQPQPSSQERPWLRAVNTLLCRRRPDLGEIQCREVPSRCLANGCFLPSIRSSPTRSRAEADMTNTGGSMERTRIPVLT